MKKYFTLTCLALLVFQSKLEAQENDSIAIGNVLDFNLFTAIVNKHHPIAYKLNLLESKGENYVKQAKGNFDPLLEGNGNQKYFDGDQYYSLLNGSITIPTWFGIEVTGGYSSSDGYYLNPQSRLPETGLYYAGISVPLGKDLFIDKRRADLKKANLYKEMTSVQRTSQHNQLLAEAGIVYWNWFWKYHELKQFKRAYELSFQRFEAIKQSALLGDQSFIDTVEANIQVQNRWLILSQAQIDFQQAQNNLNVYLWFEGNIPVEIDSTVKPPEMEETILKNINIASVGYIDSMLNVHPDLINYALKLNVIEIQENYYREQLKPKIDLKYNALSEPINSNPFANYNIENYTWGIDVSFPIFLRTERANLQLNQIEEMETMYDAAVKKEELKQKALFYNYELIQSANQYQNFKTNVDNYEIMLDSEIKLFEIGESSIFMVNTRENNFFQAQIKLIELLYKNQKAFLMYHYILGNLNQIL